MKRLNVFTLFGVVFSLIWLFSQEYNILHDNLEGICVSLGLIFILFGVVTMNYDIIGSKKQYNKIYIIKRNKKKSLD